MKTFKIFLIVATTIYALFGFLIFPKWKELERLAHAGKQTAGHVTAKEPDNHQNLRYEYKVDSRIYSGRCSSGFGGLRPFLEIMIGDEIPVSFWTEHPDISVLGDPDDLFMSWSGLLFGVLPAFSLIAGGIFAVRMRKYSWKR